MAASAYYDYALAVSHRSDVFYSDDRRDAEDFGVSNKTIWKLRTQLEKDGWFQPLDKRSKRKRNRASGLYLPIRYRVLTHDEWVAAHPGKCRHSPAPISGAGPAPISVAGEQTAPDVESTSGPDVESTSGEYPPDVETTHTGRTSFPPPDVETTAKSVSKSVSKSENPSAAKPAAPEGTVFPEWWPTLQWNEFLKYRKQRRAPVTPYAEQLAIKTLSQLRADGFDPAETIERSVFNHWLGFFPPKTNRSNFNRTAEDHREQMRKNAKALGFCLETGLPVEHCTCPVHIQSRQYVTSEFGPRRKRSPAVQAEIEAIAKEFLEEN